jgi:spermidine/putrescine transport system permease protein
MRKAVLSVLALWITLFYIGPIVIALIVSFLTPGLYGGVEWEASTQGYSYVKAELFGRTALFAGVTAVLCTLASLVISIEALLHPSPAKHRFILGLAVFTLVTNSLIKIYSWNLLLGASGPLSFLGTGILSNEKLAVLLGLVYMYLPFGLLMIFEGVTSIDPGLIRAARDLGAGDYAIARRVLLPLAWPFVVSSGFIVMVFAFADFLVPQFLGRGKLILTGNRMADLFGGTHHNWPACMAIGTVILLMLFVTLIAFRRQRT